MFAACENNIAPLPKSCYRVAICILIYFECLKQYQGMIFQHFSLIPLLSVEGFVLRILLNPPKCVALKDDL